MTDLAEYLLKANLCLAGFYALYYLLLRRHTFFALNRAYLLVAQVASFLLPLIALPAPVVETVSLPVINLPVAVLTTRPTGPAPEQILLGIYGVGVLLFLSLLGISLWRLSRLIASGDAARQSGHTLVLLADDRVPPFSFFRYLVLNRTDYAQHADPIIRHELAHIRQWHSVDVLLTELVKVLCWPNPVAWLYKRSLQQVHEYLADEQVADKAQYARFLFDYAFQTETSPVANSFAAPSLLKSRISMLYQLPTTHRVLWKYALVLPLLAVLLGLTAAREPIAELLTSQPGKNKTVSGRVVDETGKAVANATVVIAGSRRGTPTDGNGRFTLTDVSSAASLFISSVGFNSQTMPVKNLNNLAIILKRHIDELPMVGATANYRAVGINKNMPVTADPPDSQTINGEVFTVVEQNPQFPDGIPGLMYYVAHTLNYPAEAKKAGVKGTVFVTFVVTRTGTINNIRITKGLGKGCDEEAFRVVSQMPKWKPGVQNGSPVNVQFVLPIRFETDNINQASESDKTGPMNAVNPRAETDKPTALSSLKITPLGKNPLIVIDGKEVPGGSKSYDINPDNIQHINVLKGASAQAAYGDKGKDGVIEVTTKTPKP